MVLDFVGSVTAELSALEKSQQLENSRYVVFKDLILEILHKSRDT